jgi:hypothetical protein
VGTLIILAGLPVYFYFRAAKRVQDRRRTISS